MIGKGNRSQDTASSQRSARSLRRRAEEIVRENAATSPEKLDSLTPGEIRKTLHELYVHQIELGYCTICKNGLIQEANLIAATMQGDREKCIQAGMNDFIAKPVLKRELAEMIARWLSITIP